VSYARYALHQLMRICSSDPTGVLRRISTLLSRFENGEKPLTGQAELLLQDVEEWLKRNPEIAAVNDRIPDQISLLRSRLAFAAQDAKSIDFFQSKNPGSFGKSLRSAGRKTFRFPSRKELGSTERLQVSAIKASFATAPKCPC